MATARRNGSVWMKGSRMTGARPNVSQGHRARRCGVAIMLLAGAVSCAPAPQVNPVVSDLQIKMIEVGKTTHREILDIVGPPDTVWETERVWVYEEGPMRHFVVFPPGYITAGGARRLGADLFFIRFDEAYRVERVGHLQGPKGLRTTYGELLRNWLDEQEASPTSGEDPAKGAGSN